MRVLLPTVFVLSALVLAGCGGGGHEAATTTTSPVRTTTAAATTTTVAPKLTTAAARRYDKAMLALGAKLGRAVDGLYPLDTGTRGSAEEKRTIKKLNRVRAAVASVEKSLGRITPPADVKPEHEALRRDVHVVARQIAELTTSLRKGDTETFNALSQLPALSQVIAATDAIRKKGYDVLGPNG